MKITVKNFKNSILHNIDSNRFGSLHNIMFPVKDTKAEWSKFWQKIHWNGVNQDKNKELINTCMASQKP